MPGPYKSSAPLALDWARFAERFRGSEEHVKAGQRLYAPNFEGCQNVLDIGCGRGEFLEIMREAKIPAVGIDLSPESVALCRLKGLEAQTRICSRTWPALRRSRWTASSALR
jgi:2-polyprenyl-3-methyl-5-hydroxy-6-metoxy-1,4-benzoquinol methylase